MRRVLPIFTLALVACGVEDDPDFDCEASGAVCTEIGTGAHGWNGDGHPARQTWIYFPTSVRFDAQDRPIFADYHNLRIRALDEDGTIPTVAGNGFHAEATDGQATASPLENPIDAWPTPDGGFLIAEFHTGRLLSVGPQGNLQAIAGSGQLGDSGDGGPALDARMSEVAGVALADDGSVLLADTDNHRIRAVEPASSPDTPGGGTTTT